MQTNKRIGKAFDSAETERLAQEAKNSRSPHMYPAFMLARNAALRDGEIKTLTWGRVNLESRTLQGGRAKTADGGGPIVPLNSELYEALVNHRAGYEEKFGEVREEWYLFPWGKPTPQDPTKHVTSLKTAWKSMRRKAEVSGRWDDNRHTLITELAESGAGDETIMEIADHVHRQMLRHYSHIRIEAKRTALEATLKGRPVH